MSANKLGIKTEYINCSNHPIRSGVYQVRFFDYSIGKYGQDYFSYFDIDTGKWYLASVNERIAKHYFDSKKESLLLNEKGKYHKWRGILDEEFYREYACGL